MKLVVSVFALLVSVASFADCVPYEDVVDALDGDGKVREVTLSGTLGLNPIAKEILNKSQFQEQSSETQKEVKAVQFTLTTTETEIADPAKDGQKICLPKQFTLYFLNKSTLDQDNLTKAEGLLKDNKVVTVKARLSAPENSLQLINNGMLSEIQSIQ